MILIKSFAILRIGLNNLQNGGCIRLATCNKVEWTFRKGSSGLLYILCFMALFYACVMISRVLKMELGGVGTS